MKKSAFTALALACVLLAGCSSPQLGSSGEDYPHLAGNASAAQSDGKPAECSAHEVTFPSHDFMKNENNARIFEVAPFTLAFELPEEFELYTPKNADEADGGFSPILIMKDGKKIGSIDYDIYPSGKYDEDSNGEIDETQENAYRMIYNQIMLGSVVSWDCDYKEVNTSGDTIASTCRIMVRDVPEEEYAYGILARSKPLGVYVKVNIDADCVTPEIVEYIAKTIELK